MFIVYSRPGCQACKTTVRVLEKKHLQFEVRDVEERLEEFRAQGLQQLPVVVSPTGETFAGFRPDRLTA
ncbi:MULTISPECIES: glutaredoxin domain-containing protein [Corynebacterium]|uniref:NrdH-redoxin n=1 Tax=Corynebacterium suicordis DSM 45110 TaxID=1121369 RepID=A0ABR9ZLT3_9CORY|nr:NrdH-redoxin [Corynebacterium sp. ED61]MBF4554401.1 NrdH-redoxin [Corynebacterium suicordis DSM 45110]